MENEFWLDKWQKNDIAFHEGQANEQLVKHFNALALPVAARVFVPLCGKTRDIAWLLSRNYTVVGAELSELAVKQLFDELGVTPHVVDGTLTTYSAENIDIFVGDIFALSAELLGQVDAVYDRAALVALPATVRAHYTKHLCMITHTAPQLAITYTYDQSQMAGPPFSVPDEEVRQHYGSAYKLRLLAREQVQGGLKGKCAAEESVWVIEPHM
ncbi:thiopurine S-methyltransferase [Kordiimonas pumila]|uniref:Thiopurine S-methyltransferase n=1 Tax=Kordiimonas pumila TaxID=2161677 RepID=A0ABV7D6G0_9PROT|nr:thiopurine S-methyltransferase [Kordiimonas pumila]